MLENVQVLFCSFYQLDYIDVGTPLSNKYYLGQPEGEMYGLHHGRTRFQPEVSMHLRPESGVPGLFLTGIVVGTYIALDNVLFFFN